MKIRVVEKDERTSIRMCEECKEQGKEGVFLTLAFFNGFICSGCGWTLDEALRNNLFNLPYEITPVLEEYDLDNPLLDPEPRIAITKKRWEEFKQMELDAIKKIQEGSPPQETIQLGPPDAPTTRTVAPRTILNEEVTQEDWDALERRCIALEQMVQNCTNEKIRFANAMNVFKDLAEQGEAAMDYLEEAMGVK